MAYGVSNDVAVVVGVSVYIDPKMRLKYADEDARLFARTLIERMGFSKSRVLVLTSEPRGMERLSSAKAIQSAILEAARNQKDSAHSKFVFFYSGHGYETGLPGQGWMLTGQDFKRGTTLTPSQAKLTARELSNTFSQIRAQVIWSVFDMCRGGTGYAASRERNRVFQVRPNPALGNSQKIVSLFSSTNGPSYEAEKLKHSYFTYYLCEGIKPRLKPGVSGFQIVPALQQGKVTIGSLYNNAFVKVRQATKYRGSSNKRSTRNSPKTLIFTDTLMARGQLPDMVPGSNDASLVQLAEFNPRTFQPEVSDDGQFSVYLSNGMKKLSEHKYSQAVVYFMDAFELHPDDEELALLVGGSYLMMSTQNQDKEKSLSEAKKWLDKSIKRNSFPYLYLKGLYLLASDDIKKAKSVFKEIKNINNYELGEFLTYCDSINIFDLFEIEKNILINYINANPRSIPVILKLSSVYVSLHDNYAEEHGLKEAIKWYDRALQLEPDNVEALTALGKLLIDRLGRKDGMSYLQRAEAIYKNYLSLNPEDAGSMIDFAYLLDDLGKGMEGENWFRKAVQIEPENSNNIKFFADFLRDFRDKSFEAMKWYEAAEKLTPNDVDMIDRYASMAAERGETVKSEYLYRKLIEIDPADTSYLNGYLSVLKQLGKNSEFEKIKKSINEFEQNDNIAVLRFIIFKYDLYNEVELKDGGEGDKKAIYSLILKKDFNMVDVDILKDAISYLYEEGGDEAKKKSEYRKLLDVCARRVRENPNDCKYLDDLISISGVYYRDSNQLAPLIRKRMEMKPHRYYFGAKSNLKNDEIMRFYDESINKRYLFPEDMNSYARYLKGIGFIEESLILMKRALADRPDSVGTIVDIAEIYVEKNGYKEALKWFQRGEKTDPYDKFLLLSSINFYQLKLKNTKKFIEYAEKSIHRFPNDHLILSAVAEALLKGGDHASLVRAEGYINRAVQRAETDWLQYDDFCLKAQILLALDKRAEAREAALQAKALEAKGVKHDTHSPIFKELGLE